MEKIPGPSSTETTPPSVENLKIFNDAFPGVIQDGVLDAAKLGELLNVGIAEVKDGKERFGLMWAGRQKAVEALQAPSYAALTPDLSNSVNWDTAENVFIEGDNLEVLKLLQNAYNDQVKLIYIDPPYNTGNDFVYNDDFTDQTRHYLEVTGQADSEGNRLVANTEVSGRKHSNWLTMMYPRLALARNLLTQDGLLAMSIDKNELHHAILILNEIFGEENQLGVISVVNNLKGRSDEANVATAHEFLVLYSRGDFISKGLPLPGEISGTYKLTDHVSGNLYRLLPLRKSGTNSLRTDRPNMYYPFFVDPQSLTISLEQAEGLLEVFPLFPDGKEGRWRWGIDTAKSRLQELVAKEMSDGRIDIQVKDYLDSGDGARRAKAKSVWIDPKFTSDKGTYEIKELFGEAVFDHPKPVDFIKEILELSVSTGDIVMDFFAGSGTTGHAVLAANKDDGGRRKFVLVTIDEPTSEGSVARNLGYEKVSQITLERLRRVSDHLEIPKDLKVLKLGPSNFISKIEASKSNDLHLIHSKTLGENVDHFAAITQIALSLGSILSDTWVQIDGVENTWKIGNLLISASTTPGMELLDLAKTLECSSIACLEDYFAGRDDLRSNFYFASKKSNMTFKTF